MEDTLDDLTLDEIQELKDQGLIPPEWQPGEHGMMQQEFAPGPAEAGGPLPGPALPERAAAAGMNAEDVPQGGLGMASGAPPDLPGGLGAVMPGANAAEPSPVAAGMANLKANTAPSPDPMAQRFSEIALSYLPTDDKDLKTARGQAEAAAAQLSALRAAAESKAQEFPWAEFGGAMLAGGSPRFMQQLGTATLASEKVRREGEANVQKMGLTEVDAKLGAASALEKSNMDKVRTAADLANAAAAIQRATSLHSGVGGVGVQTAAVKNTVAQGLQPGTPEFDIELRRQAGALNMKGDAAYKMTLNANPGMDPAKPEFAAAYLQAQKDIAQTKKTGLETKAQIAANAVTTRQENTRSNMDYKAKLVKEAQDARDSTEGLSPDTVKMLSQQAWAGDKSGIAGFGRNKKARAQIAEGINEEGRRLGKSGADLAAMNSEFMGATRAQTALGTRIGSTAGAVEEANGLIPSLLNVHSRIKGLTDYPMLNQATLWTLRNTPIAGKQAQADAAELDSRLNTFASVYARGMYGGVPTVDMLKHAREVIDNKMATMSFENVLKAMTQEMSVAMSAPGKASKNLSAERKKGGETIAPITGDDPLGIRGPR